MRRVSRHQEAEELDGHGDTAEVETKGSATAETLRRIGPRGGRNRLGRRPWRGVIGGSFAAYRGRCGWWVVVSDETGERNTFHGSFVEVHRSLPHMDQYPVVLSCSLDCQALDTEYDMSINRLDSNGIAQCGTISPTPSIW